MLWDNMKRSLVKKLLGGALAVSLATAGAVGGYKYKQKKDFEEIFEATKVYAESVEKFRKEPSNRNELAKYTAEDKIDELMKKKREWSLSNYFLGKELFYLNYTIKDIEHNYIGKLQEMSEVGNTTVYISKMNDEGFKGFAFPKPKGTSSDLTTSFSDKKDWIVHIDLYSLRCEAEIMGYLKKGEKLPEKMKNSGLIHELVHTEEGGGEFEAYSAQMEHCNHEGDCSHVIKPLEYIINLKNPNEEDKKYAAVGAKVLKKYEKMKSYPADRARLNRIENKIKNRKILLP